MYRGFLVIVSIFFSSLHGISQEISQLLLKSASMIHLVQDYQASGKMKTNVAFLKVPVSDINVYFKKPNKLKIKSEKGISFIPKGAVSINMNNMLTDKNFTVIDAGTEKISGRTLRIAKLLPVDDNADVILSTIYIDPVSALIYKTKTTTRDNGTYELEMSYGKYASYALPDKIIFSFNTKDYKLPKGMTFDFDDGKTPAKTIKNKKGRAEISFSSYIINKGLPSNIFN